MLFEDVTPSGDGGVTKTLVKPGEGEDHPANGCKVYLHYVGRLENGDIFDSSRQRGDVFEFNLGQGQVIKGWDIGVATMLRNEICELKIAPNYAYGDEGFPPQIPPQATLIFEIELLNWDDETITKDGSVRKRLIKEGVINGGKPNLEGRVKIHLRGTCEGEMFDERDVEFIIGDGFENDIPEGIEKGLLTMKRYEKAKFFIKAEYTFGQAWYNAFGLTPNTSEIVYEIVLFDFDRHKEIYQMNYHEKVEKASQLKERGLKRIKANDYEKAAKVYEKLLTYVTSTKDESDFVEGLPLRIAGNLNAALCYLKLHNFLKAKSKSENAVELEPGNVKGNFRLGEAHMGLKDYEAAAHAYTNTLKYEPDNTAAKKQLAAAKVLQKKQNEYEKKLYTNIFAGLSEE